MTKSETQDQSKVESNSVKEEEKKPEYFFNGQYFNTKQELIDYYNNWGNKPATVESVTYLCQQLHKDMILQLFRLQRRVTNSQASNILRSCLMAAHRCIAELDNQLRESLKSPEEKAADAVLKAQQCAPPISNSFKFHGSKEELKKFMPEIYERMHGSESNVSIDHLVESESPKSESSLDLPPVCE